jgi:hypothetical protein
MSTVHEVSPAAPDGFWDGPNGLRNLIDLGIRVIPVVPGAKTPAIQNWQYGRKTPRKNGTLPSYSSSSATNDPELLRKRFEKGIRPNVGIPTGQPWRSGYLDVIDVDPRNGGDVSMVELHELIGRPPPTATVRTLNGGTHIYVTSPVRWMDTPKEILPGVEFKRAGQFVMAPPSNGYRWVSPLIGEPIESGISSWSELDCYLGVSLAAKSSGLNQETVETGTPVVPELESWSSPDNHLFAIATAPPGGRTEALLRYGGKVAFATAVGRGLASPSAVESALWRACETSGLVDDYPVAELERKIGVYAEWSDPSKNPLLLSPRTEQNASSVFGHRDQLLPSERLVLADLGRQARAQPKRYSERYAAKATGLSKTGAGSAIKSLRAKGLIEPGQSVPTVLPNGTKTRNTNTYKLTAQGNAVLNALRVRP